MYHTCFPQHLRIHVYIPLFDCYTKPPPIPTTCIPNLLERNFKFSKPNEAWVGDITYMPTDEGWLHLAVVKDLCLKKVVGYAFSARIDTSLTLAVLEMAVPAPQSGTHLPQRPRRPIRCLCLSPTLGIRQSMSRKGDPFDNAVAENFFSCLKCYWCITVGLLQDSRLRTPFLPTLRRFTILCALIPPSAGCLQHSLNALF